MVDVSPKKEVILFYVVLFLFSLCSYAQGIPLTTSLSFAPPASDSSIQFLSNIFGIVDGVLSGTGSQIFGTMMGVFNAAILSLGSIIIVYTLMVGTMNTAHDGEFLGRKWSSIWIPLRCSTGMLLIVPKASGYCMMQIFMMWVVVQGVGAADKIWSSALHYLNRGGKIVQAQMNSREIINSYSDKQDSTFIGASAILTGQVCMLAAQRALEKTQNHYINQAATTNSGPCYNPNDQRWIDFCQTSVPDFLASVNSVTYQNSKQGWLQPNSYAMPMPNFSTGIYSSLNGMCGEIHWNNVNNLASNVLFNQEEMQSFNMSRAIAVAQMYSNLLIVANAMVENNPALSTQSNLTDNTSSIANLQYGVAKNEIGDTCQMFQDSSLCGFWKNSTDLPDTGVLFAGNELINAIAAYDGLMMPILNLQQEMQNAEKFQQVRNFITQTEQTGWMFSGAYFFNLVNLTGPANKINISKDLSSGLEASKFYSIPDCNRDNTGLCWFLKPQGGFTHYEKMLLAMLQGWGKNSANPNDCNETLTFSSSGSFQSSQGYVLPEGAYTNGACATTALGFIGNSYFFHIPQQPGIVPPSLPDFSMLFVKMLPSSNNFSSQSPTGCVNKTQFAGMTFCMSNGIEWFFHDLLTIIAKAISSMLGLAINVLIVIPLKVCIWPQMQYAMQILTNMSNNPIVDLANMGASFIQSTLYSYLGMLAVSGLGAFPMMGGVILILVAFLTPLYTAWLSYFVMIGFTTCYYIPLLPYMIFTFGVIAWFFAVIEALVAAPIMALGVATPEGEGLLGKGEHGLMLLVNVFLRPSMMVIGFVTGIALSYVGIWVLNSGFDIAAGFLKIDASEIAQAGMGSENIYGINWGDFPFAQLLGCMFYVVIYVSAYLTIIQKTFTLIYLLPDKILRWIGGHPETLGTETQSWFQDGAQKLEQFGKATDQGIESGLNRLSKQFSADACPEQT